MYVVLIVVVRVMLLISNQGGNMRELLLFIAFIPLLVIFLMLFSYFLG